MLKKIIIFSLVLGLFSGIMAKESNYEIAKTPELVLSLNDLSVIEKAMEKGLSKLSKKEKKLIQKFLLDYAISAKHEKCKDGDDCFPIPSDKKFKKSISRTSRK